MKRFLLGLLCFVPLYVSAQVQQGYVRTVGKPDRKGEPLGGVAVRFAGGYNAVRSDSLDGTFAVRMPNMKEGDPYVLQSVIRGGYELADKEFLSRRHPFSSRVPLEVVMISRAELRRISAAIEDRARAEAERNYLARIETLEQELAGQKISVEEYRRQLQECQRQFDSFDEAIAVMADRYARTDYDRLDTLNARINRCIVAGEFVRADSLIRSKGSLAVRFRASREGRARVQKLRQAVVQAEAAEERNADDLAQDLYHVHSIFLSRFQTDSAVYYIRMRADLDTLNCDYQNEAGVFILQYTADYKTAMCLFRRALAVAESRYGAESAEVATSYNNLGLVYDAQGDYAGALEYHRKSLSIREKVFGPSHPDVAESYNNLGAVYSAQGDYTEALEYYRKSLSIREKVFGPSHPSVALSYNNLGQVYHAQGDYTGALEYYRKSLSILEKVFGPSHPSVALSYNNIGAVYSTQGDYAGAIEYHRKSLSIWEKVFGPSHPNVALSYNNLGQVYHAQGDYTRALEYYRKSLSIWEKVFGPSHPSVALSYNNLGLVYHTQGDYTGAIEYYRKSLSIYEKVFGPSHPNVALSYNNLGQVYHAQGDYAGAIEYYRKSLSIWEKVFGPSHPNVVISYGNIGWAYFLSGAYMQALSFFKKAWPHLKSEERLMGLVAIGTCYDRLLEQSDDPELERESEQFLEESLEKYPDAMSALEKLIMEGSEGNE